MVIFLTGDRGVGKSTALRRALMDFGPGIGGFMTDFGDSRYAPEKTLRLLPWAETPDFSAGAVCARLGPGFRQADPAVFDGLGVRLLRAAAREEACRLILMDELGFLEAEARAFRREVLNILTGPKPVLGVIRQGLGVWKGAPLGEIWPVTPENRDRIPALLRQRLSEVFPKNSII